jgi:hypothetical protein
MEERRTAELLSDFDDYEIDDAGDIDSIDGGEMDKARVKKKKKNKKAH